MKYLISNDVDSNINVYLEPSEKNYSYDSFVPKTRNTFLVMEGDSKITTSFCPSGSVNTLKINNEIFFNYSLNDINLVFKPSIKTYLGNLFNIYTDDKKIYFSLYSHDIIQKYYNNMKQINLIIKNDKYEIIDNKIFIINRLKF